MGRLVKLTDQRKAWFTRLRRCERVYETREERQYILVVCEGIETEPNYFEAFKKELPREVVDIAIEGEGMNTISLVERAEELRTRRAMTDVPFDQVWVVFDKNSFDPDDFDNAINKAQSKNMLCAWSNEAFELWYILHFEYRTTGMPRDEYKGKLKEHLGEIYKKNDPEMYDKLRRKGDQLQAIAWARRLHAEARAAGTPPSGSNPCTTVYALVEELNKFKRPSEPADG
jgi:hypothetical protein